MSVYVDAQSASEAPVEELIEAARRVLNGGRRRRILGLTGPPGAGKSALAEVIVAALTPNAVLVPMDGFHLAQSQLARLGRQERKGAPDTFDAAGYVALLRRLRDLQEPTVYAPQFRRELEESIAGTIAIPREAALIVTEGNYLLLDVEPWAALRELIDEVWYLDPGKDIRIERLVARHVAYGKSLEAAQTWAYGSDQRNAVLVEQTRTRADRVVRVAPKPSLEAHG